MNENGLIDPLIELFHCESITSPPFLVPKLDQIPWSIELKKNLTDPSQNDALTP
jgi:hypothetical protein